MLVPSTCSLKELAQIVDNAEPVPGMSIALFRKATTKGLIMSDNDVLLLNNFEKIIPVYVEGAFAHSPTTSRKSTDSSSAYSSDDFHEELVGLERSSSRDHSIISEEALPTCEGQKEVERRGEVHAPRPKISTAEGAIFIEIALSFWARNEECELQLLDKSLEEVNEKISKRRKKKIVKKKKTVTTTESQCPAEFHLQRPILQCSIIRNEKNNAILCNRLCEPTSNQTSCDFTLNNATSPPSSCSSTFASRASDSLSANTSEPTTLSSFSNLEFTYPETCLASPPLILNNCSFEEVRDEPKDSSQSSDCTLELTSCSRSDTSCQRTLAYSLLAQVMFHLVSLDNDVESSYNSASVKPTDDSDTTSAEVPREVGIDETQNPIAEDFSFGVNSGNDDEVSAEATFVLGSSEVKNLEQHSKVSSTSGSPRTIRGIGGVEYLPPEREEALESLPPQDSSENVTQSIDEIAVEDDNARATEPVSEGQHNKENDFEEVDEEFVEVSQTETCEVTNSLPNMEDESSSVVLKNDNEEDKESKMVASQVYETSNISEDTKEVYDEITSEPFSLMSWIMENNILIAEAAAVVGVTVATSYFILKALKKQ